MFVFNKRFDVRHPQLSLLQFNYIKWFVGIFNHTVDRTLSVQKHSVIEIFAFVKRPFLNIYYFTL